MARLHEYQGKAILAANGFKIPRGRAASTPDDAVTVLACDVECRLAGIERFHLELDIPGLDEAIGLKGSQRENPA